MGDISALTVEEEEILLIQSMLCAITWKVVCLSSPCTQRKKPREDLIFVKYAFPMIHFLFPPIPEYKPRYDVVAKH